MPIAKPYNEAMEICKAAMPRRILAMTSSATPASVGVFQSDGHCEWAYVEEGLRTGEGLLAAVATGLKAVTTDGHRGPASPDLIMLDQGPGQFTGLRAGIGIAQGLAMGWNIPVLAMDSASIMVWAAWEALEKTRHSDDVSGSDREASGALLSDALSALHWITVRDARLGAFYVAEFGSLEGLFESEGASVQTLGPERLLDIVKNRLTLNPHRGSIVIVSDPSSQARLAEFNGFDDVSRAKPVWMQPRASDLLGALARLGLAKLRRGAQARQAQQLEANYVRNDVAMDLNAQRAYRRAQGDLTKI